MTIDIPHVLWLISFIIGGGVIALSLFNRSFRLYPDKGFFKRALPVSFMASVPFIILAFLISSEVHNKTISAKDRVESVLMLGSLQSDYENSEMSLFLEESRLEDYSELVSLFKNKLTIESLLQSSNTKEKLVKLGYVLSDYKLKQIEVLQVVEFMDKYRQKNDLGFHFSSKFGSFFSNQKVDQSVVDQYVNSNSNLKQFAAILFAGKNMTNEKYIEYIMGHKNQIDPKILNNKYMKRKIASIKDKVKGPKTKEVLEQ